MWFVLLKKWIDWSDFNLKIPFFLVCTWADYCLRYSIHIHIHFFSNYNLCWLIVWFVSNQIGKSKAGWEGGVWCMTLLRELLNLVSSNSQAVSSTYESQGYGMSCEVWWCIKKKKKRSDYARHEQRILDRPHGFSYSQELEKQKPQKTGCGCV